MKKLTLLLLIGIVLDSHAQLALPYDCDFSDPTQNAEWQEFRTGSLATPFYHWVITGTPGNPQYLYHDYPVEANSDDTTKDWFVSPALNVSDGAELSLKINLFSMTGSAWPTDEISIYLFEGSPDPELATKTLLADLTSFAANSNIWKDTTEILIPAVTGEAHIAFKYQTTNNWITPMIDDISIIATPNRINSMLPDHLLVSVFPNPTENIIHLQYRDLHINRLQLSGITGKIIKTFPPESKILDLSNLAAGLYFLNVKAEEGEMIEKIKLE